MSDRVRAPMKFLSYTTLIGLGRVAMQEKKRMSQNEGRGRRPPEGSATPRGVRQKITGRCRW